MKLIAAVTLSLSILVAQTERTPSHFVTAVRHWSLNDVTRVAVEVSGDFNFVTERLHNPERVYFDIPNSRPRIESRRAYSEAVDDKLLKKIRVAETVPGVTRVVLDLGPSVEASTSQLANPSRLIVELRAGLLPPIPTQSLPSVPTSAVPSLPAAVSRPEPKPEPPLPVKAPAKAPEKVDVPAAAGTAPSAKPQGPKPSEKTDAPDPVASARTQPRSEAPAAGKVPSKSSEKPDSPDPRSQPRSESSASAKPAGKSPEPLATPDAVATNIKPQPKSDPPAPVKPPEEVASVEPSKSQLAKPASVERLEAVATSAATSPSSAGPISGELGKAARHTSTGETSLVRALGLKIGRVVIDPGHGGHDHGTEGAKGLLEKDLVLDVSLRLGKLIEDRMNAEVIFTRSDDTFIPLEGRTALANEKKADLFLSIHANSSPVARIEGVETYYLNFTESKDALDVASRENASSQKSIFELRDIIQKITLHDKAEESKEFASRIQTSLYSFSSKSFPNNKNRGVKKAPFVVLIGANMPSVLAEIGFLSNSREESLLKRSDYRQKLAEALYRGISRYAEGLSHFQVAKAQE